MEETLRQKWNSGKFHKKSHRSIATFDECLKCPMSCHPGQQIAAPQRTAALKKRAWIKRTAALGRLCKKHATDLFAAFVSGTRYVVILENSRL